MKRHLACLSLSLGMAAVALPARADFSSCVAGLRSQALGAGVSGAVFDRAMSGMQPDMDVIKAMNTQPEFKTPIWGLSGRACR